MQQQNLSQPSCLSMGSKVIANNNQNNNNNNNGTVASRMLHSLINEYDNNLNNNNFTDTYNYNNTQSIPQQSPRQQYTIEQNYYKSNLIVMKIGNNGQQIQDGQEEGQYQYKHDLKSSQRSRVKQNQVQRADDDYNNINQKIQNSKQDKESNINQNNNNTNQNIQNTNINNINNQNNIINQNILQQYRSNMSIQSQSQLVQLMVKRQSQLKQLQNFIMKQIQQINQSKQRNSRIKQFIANVNNEIIQTRELYCESKQSIYREMNQMREFMMDKCQSMIVALIKQHKQSTQVYIQQINDLRQQIQRKQMEMKRLQHEQIQQQIRQVNQNNSIKNNHNHKSNVPQHPQQQHLQLSFSADNTNNDIKQKQLINTILISQQQQLNNNLQKQQQQHNNNSNLQQQQQQLNNNLQKQQQQHNMGWQNNNNNDNVYNNRVQFQVQTSSIEQGTGNSRQQQQQHQCNNNAQVQQNKQPNILNSNKHKSLTHSESHSQSQQLSSPLNHHLYTNQQFNPTNQQTSQVLRMNTLSFSMNNGNDQLSTINQLDVFDDNFNLVHNQNINDDHTQGVNNNCCQYQRKSVIRSQGRGCVYSFKKNNTHKRHVSGDDNFREYSVVDIKVDHCDQNNYVDVENTGDNNSQEDTKTNTKTITRNKDSTSSVAIPKLPLVSSPSLINLHPVPLQQQHNNNQPLPSSSQTTKRRKSPHRYDYCRLYQQQQLREIQNLNDMCNNILRGNSNGNMIKSNDVTQRNLTDNNDDVIKMRLSQLKKDSYPSFSGSSSSNTAKLYPVGNHINNNNLLMSSPSSQISSSIIGLSKSSNSPLHSNSHSHSRKKLTIEIPQSPNLQHNPSLHNPYYKIQNHVHQMSVQQFSPQRERLRDNINGLNGRNISGRYQININDNQLYKQTTQSIKDRKEYIRSKIQNIKKKNNLSNNNNNNVVKNNNNSIYKDSQQYTNSRSPRVISFLKSSQEQQNTPSRVQLQRPSAVNRVGMMVNINNNNNDRSLSNKDRFNNSNKQLQMQRSQQHLISDNVVNNNSRHVDVNIKIKERLQRQNRYQKKSNTKGYDFTQDKLEKKMKQNNLSKSYNNNNNSNNINTYNINTRSKQPSFIYTREFSQQNSVHSNNNNNINQQLNHHNNNNNNNNKPAVNHHYRNSNINNNTTILSSSSNTMSPLKVSTRNNNSLYLHQQQSSLMTATKKHSISQQYYQHHQQSKHTQQNLYTKNHHPYIVTNDNERKKLSTSNINNISNKKSYKNYQYQQQQGDNLRRYDPVKSVAGFRRF